MNGQLIDIILYLVGFCLFLIVQSLSINGWHECFQGKKWKDIEKGDMSSGNIFYKISPSFFERHRGKAWTMCLWGCVRCESSVIGSITFWGSIVPVFGFHWIEILPYVFDLFALVSINWIIYKKL
jgi:hypothetical protein